MPLFDHLVGDCKYARRDCQTKRLRSLEIDDKVEFGWLHYRKIAGFFTLEDEADVTASLSVRAGETTAGPDETGSRL
jgi:hypothetical protein